MKQFSSQGTAFVNHGEERFGRTRDAVEVGIPDYRAVHRQQREVPCRETCEDAMVNQIGRVGVR